MSSSDRRVTVPALMAMKSAGRKISMLTAYDYPTARLLDAMGIEAILVGDTLGMVVQGHPNTLPVTMRQMIYHAEMVGRAVRHALVIVDMPFASYQLGPRKAIANAARILKRTDCQAVKLESGAGQAEVIAALVAAGIPVMAHCGLRPQSIHQLGQFALQRDRQQLLADAQAAEQAGAFIPTIGIGSGAGCDGQVLVIHDLLGLTADRVPRHVKIYADLKDEIARAVGRYRDDVRSGAFPGPEQTLG